MWLNAALWLTSTAREPHMSDGSGLTFVPPLLPFQAPVAALTHPVTSHLLIPRGAITLSDSEHFVEASLHQTMLGRWVGDCRQTDRQTRRLRLQ